MEEVHVNVIVDDKRGGGSAKKINSISEDLE
jgi:hypothetical protein